MGLRTMKARTSHRRNAVLAAAVYQLGAVTPAEAAQLVNSSGACADIQRGDTSDGTPMMLFHCHGSPNQNWILTGGTVTGENGVCLDVSGSVPKDGTPIIVVQCNGRPSQKWQVVNGQVVGLGGKCLDPFSVRRSERRV